MNRKIYLAVIVSLIVGPPLVHAENPPVKRAFTFTDLMAIKRVGEPVPSPDGKWVAFDAVDVNLDENTKRTHLWIVPSEGGDARRLNPSTENDESRPRFSPDGHRLIFTSKAGDAPQVWITGFDANTGTLMGTARALTALSTGASDAIWSPDGKNVVFVSSIYPDAKDDAANKERDETLRKSKVKAQLFTHLFYRHWNAFTEFKRSHLFAVSADDNPDAAPRDLTPGDHDVPPFSLGGQDMYALSPDGRELAYTSNIDEVEATSTNNEIFIVPLAGGEPKKISTSPGSDSTPVYSPDGKWLAWRSQARAGFESDKFALIVYDRQSGQLRDATAKFDRSVESIAWAPDAKSICFTAEDHGEAPIYSLPLDQVSPTEMLRVHADDLAFSPDGKRLFFSETKISTPSEIASLDLTRAHHQREHRTPDAARHARQRRPASPNSTCRRWNRSRLKARTMPTCKVSCFGHRALTPAKNTR